MQHADRIAAGRVTREGRVVRCANGEIEVMLDRIQCTTCNGGCGLGCRTAAVARLPAAGRRVGERVLVSIDREPVRHALYRVFGLPLAGLLLGAAAADQWIASQWSGAGAPGDVVIAGCAAVGLLAGLVAARGSLRACHGYRIDVVDAPGRSEASLTGAAN